MCESLIDKIAVLQERRITEYAEYETDCNLDDGAGGNYLGCLNAGGNS